MRAPPVDLKKLEAVRHGPRRDLPYDGSAHELTFLGLVPRPQQRLEGTLRLEEHLQCLDFYYTRPWEAAGKGLPVNESKTNDGDLGSTPRCMRRSRWAVGLAFVVIVGVFVGLDALGYDYRTILIQGAANRATYKDGGDTACHATLAAPSGQS
ncbi:hypothetical protein MGG_18095 [Pyricularia oryzae 70-15]|nr:uncharacterized protein MGG_18095 [Pyricularia oryzae 70-15]EHA46767.1 hypothetical protein MGG_18095 [Pyricularia oryzae 70-15]